MPARGSDPFQTEDLRRRVLSGWAASPSRFREDANAEEDYALGGYRDRVVVELAQNAADAAVRAGVPGRLRLTLRDATLTAANTGAPLDAAGVEALSTLRASGKRPGAAAGAGEATVGRFGVGFAAVVAVSDCPRIRSAEGLVRWSRERSRELAGAIPALAGELAARSGHVPVLRLPFADADADADGGDAVGGAGRLADGYATAVELPLRDAAAVELVERLLAQAGPALLLALPALAEVIIETPGATRVLTAVHSGDRATVTDSAAGPVSAWRVTEAGGELDPALLAARPAEERARTAWSVRWAVPVDEDGAPAGRLPGGVAAVVHAPTPTDEPLGLPALLLASFPLSPDRRHVAPGPLTAFLLQQAAATYARLLQELPAGRGLLDLVPRLVGRGELDSQLGTAITAALARTAFLPAADPGSGRVAPRDALLLETGLTAPEPGNSVSGNSVSGASASGLARWLAPVLPSLVAGPARHPAWAVLEVRRVPLAELCDLLAALDREPAWWHGLYAELAGVPAEERAELGALPVPLADGRQARGPRGLLLPGPGLAHPDQLAVLGLRLVAPGAAHPLLARLGAVEATPRGVLDDPATRAAVAASYDRAAEAYLGDDSPQQTANAVLGLVAAAGIEPGEYPWLGDLALPGDDGDWYPAAELLLPGSPLAAVVAGDVPFGTVSAGFAGQHGPRALEAAGVLSTFGLLRAHDVALDKSAAGLDVDGSGEWAADVRLRLAADADAGDERSPLPPVAAEVLAVRDLDLVDSGRWPQALELLTRPPLRAALTTPARVLRPGGRYADVPGYTAWWLRRNLALGGRRPGDLRLAGSDPLLAGLYDVAAGPAVPPAVLDDPAVARALGLRSSLTGLLAEPGGADELLARLADPGRAVTRPQLRALYCALAAAGGLSEDNVTPPDQVRAVLGDTLTVAAAGDTLILDTPDLWPLAAGRPLLLAPYQDAARLADLLDLPLASQELAGAVESDGTPAPVPDLLRDVLPGAPATYTEHDELIVDGTDVPWRYAGGELHAATVEGLAHGLAWAAGHWPARHTLTALLLSPGESARLLAEADLG